MVLETWINHSLYNGTGESTDTVFSDFDHPAVRTQVGSSMPYLSMSGGRLLLIRSMCAWLASVTSSTASLLVHGAPIFWNCPKTRPNTYAS